MYIYLTESSQIIELVVTVRSLSICLFNSVVVIHPTPVAITPPISLQRHSHMIIPFILPTSQRGPAQQDASPVNTLSLGLVPNLQLSSAINLV